jgi:2-oxoglutarate dehydrogenase E1 component
MDKYSYISNADVGYLDQLYQAYKKDPTSVDLTWQKFFEGYDFSTQRFGNNGNGHAAVAEDALTIKETQVRTLIHAYRSRAHLKSKTNPVRERRNHEVPLDHKFYGLTDADLDAEFDVGVEIGLGRTTLRKIIEKLEKVYLGTIGFEYSYIRNEEIMDWFIQKCEKEYYSYNPSLDEKKSILSKLNEAVVFENFLHTKFLGQKRFSLEGGENTIPALQTIINKAAELGVREVVIGMAHRGRLNVLSNILGKTYEQIFTEFEGNINPDLTMGDGDVKYHLGYASHIETPSGKKIYLKLTPNPSHLEAIDPLVIGYTRGQIDDEYKGQHEAMAILIHGDASVAGQGIVYEVVQMSGLEGYSTGGTVHFVINNQIGFTTDYDDARSSIYCTDVAKIIDAPVLHVNGDDAEAVTFCAKLAVEYRQKFEKDIFIDMLCYRRHGHNESDEPKFTQPKLYNLIAKHPNPREVFVKKLIERGDVDAAMADELDKNFRNQLQDRLNEVKQKPLPYKPQKMEEEWEKMHKAKPEDFDQSPETGIPQGTFDKVAKALITIPEGFKPLKQIEKLLVDRKAAYFESKVLGWAEAELLAYGSLLTENVPVRMSGQDVKRGTFSHRHAYFFDANTNDPYCGLDHIDPNQPRKFQIYNSLLSEFGVLGFEYGYAMSTPSALVLWEAQFGDFVNGAQVMIDQFISSAESKWQRMNGLVMLLPHGYEGQGPEHSSCRPERFLQLSAEYNMIVANPTTPSNIFHLLRRQVTWGFRKPCIVFSPKSLLRHPAVISPASEFTKGTFREVLDDPNANAKDVKRVVLCSGKIYYDFAEAQQKKKIKDTALVRIEQLHPFPEKQLAAVLKKYKGTKLIWAQEEPSNMGCLSYIQRVMPGQAMEFVSRKASASPATGYSKVHKSEQEKIVNQALGISDAAK